MINHSRLDNLNEIKEATNKPKSKGKVKAGKYFEFDVLAMVKSQKISRVNFNKLEALFVLFSFQDVS